MNEFEKWAERFQNTSYHVKIMILWIGAPLVTALIIYGWFTFAGFGINETIAQKPAENENVSKWEVFKNGFKATFQEIQSFVKTVKEKINQTNSFNIEAPKNEDNEILKTADPRYTKGSGEASVKDVFGTAATTSVEVGNENSADNSVFKITSVEISTTTKK